jgi:rhodanese-related sulfurtransferase
MNSDNNKNIQQTFLLHSFREFLNETDKSWNYITPYDFYHKYYHKKPFILDIREKKDFDSFHMKGAVNIFWLDLLSDENLKLLPKNKKIFVICYVGHTSSQALVILKMLGYNAIGIKFGYGKSPVFEVPVAGWLNYNYPVV